VGGPTNPVSSVLRLRAGRTSGYGRAGEAMLRFENNIQILARNRNKQIYIYDENESKIISAVGFKISEKNYIPP
jgi:hypothetical protein